MKEFEYLLRIWNLIEEGSVQCELSQENKMIGVHLTSDTAIIDIKHPSTIKLISPFIKKRLEPKICTQNHIQDRGSILLGVLDAFRAKRMQISKYLSIAQELASDLAENKKYVILTEKGRQLAKIGYGADSLGMRLINLEHVEVNDLSALMRLLGEVKLG